MIAAVNASGARNAIPGLPGGETPSFREMVRRISLGKTLIFTDNADWSDMEIVRGAQHHVEECVPRRTPASLRPPLDGPEGACFLLRPRPAAVQSSGAHRRGLTMSAFELPTRPNPGNRCRLQETLCDVVADDRRPPFTKLST